MKNQVDQITIMSKTLERSGFAEGQPAAIVETVALAMETFGVTPEILDDRLNKVMDFVREQIADIKAEVKEQIADVKSETKKQFAELNEQIADVKSEAKEQFADVKSEGKERVGAVKVQVEDVRARLEDVKSQGEQQFEIVMAQIRANSADIRTLQQSVDGLKEGMLDHQRSMFRIMMTFMVGLLAVVLGVFGVLLQQLLTP